MDLGFDSGRGTNSGLDSHAGGKACVHRELEGTPGPESRDRITFCRNLALDKNWPGRRARCPCSRFGIDIGGGCRIPSTRGSWAYVAAPARPPVPRPHDDVVGLVAPDLGQPTSESKKAQRELAPRQHCQNCVGSDQDRSTIDPHDGIRRERFPGAVLIPSLPGSEIEECLLRKGRMPQDQVDARLTESAVAVVEHDR